MKQVETRKSEVRITTLELKKMLNKYICKRVLKKWNETFVDESTGETHVIERTQVLYERGTLVTKDVLSKIQFDIEAKEITEPIELSNQCRDGYEFEQTALVPWAAKVLVGDKNIKYLLYASSIENVIEILRDYVELNCTGGFSITEAKEFTSCIILTDTLSDKMKGSDIDKEYLKGNIDFETYCNARTENIEEEKSDSQNEAKKFYQLDLLLKYSQDDGIEGEYPATFVVHTLNVDRAMLIINAYLNAHEAKNKRLCEEKGEEFHAKTFDLTIDKAVPVPFGCYIPKEFSLAYAQQ